MSIQNARKRNHENNNNSTDRERELKRAPAGVVKQGTFTEKQNANWKTEHTRNIIRYTIYIYIYKEGGTMWQGTVRESEPHAHADTQCPSGERGSGKDKHVRKIWENGYR